MNIRQNLVAPAKYSLKCPNPMDPIGICVHNTANDAAASGEIQYMKDNANSTSFHIAVDDIEAVQGIPLDRNAWHAGDGSNGEGNRKYIGIEICYSKTGGDRFDKAETNAIELIAQMLKERGWGVEKVKKHQDFSGKYCPHRTLDLGWDRFINRIKVKLGGSMAETDAQKITRLESELADANKNKNSLQSQVDGFVRDTTGENSKFVLRSTVESKVKESYDKGFADGKSQTNTSPVESEFVVNGKTVEITEGNTKTITNYRVK